MLTPHLESILIQKYHERKTWRSTPEFTQHEAAYDASGAGKNAYIGPMMGFIKALRPKTFGEWYLHYMLEQEGLERCLAAAEQLRLFATNLTAEEAFRHMVVHSADQTWEGYQREVETVNTLNELLHELGSGCSASLVDHEYDNKYRIDALIYNEDEHPVMGIQIKSMSYFARHFYTKEGLPSWQKKSTHQKHLMFQYEHEIPTAFVAHGRDGAIHLYLDATEYEEEMESEPEVKYQKGDIWAILETPVRSW